MSATRSAAPLGLLLLEDSPADSRLLVESLRERVNDGSVVIQTVRRLADALRELKRFRFSCVLVDLGLPDGEGVAHVSRIREADPGIAIVVLTGLADQSAASEAFRLGAHDYLIKGERLGDELLDFVRRAIEKSGGGRSTGEAGEPVTAPAPTADPLAFQLWVDLSRGRYAGVHANRPATPDVTAQALAALRTWVDAGLADIRVALSVPPSAVEEFIGAFPLQLDRAGVAASRISLRLDAAMTVEGAALDALQRLRAEGAQIWLEGWSPARAALRPLLRGPVDGLVLDAETMAAFLREPAEADLRFLRASLALAASLHLNVIADGVAFAEQHARLSMLGCRYLQGPWYGPAELAADLPARWQRGPAGLDRRNT